jgi:hypothetical protein
MSRGALSHKRLHINDLITEPGTVEVDLGGLYSFTTSGFSLPSALKWTPEGDSLFLGRTEFSVAFDSVSSAIDTGGRTTQFSDRLTFAATSILYDSEHFDLGVAPVVTAFLRGDSGSRIGGNAIARFDAAGNSLGFSTSWSGATTASATNPAGVWDFDLAYGRQLGGRLQKFTPHLDAVLERATGLERTIALFGGLEYQLSPRLAIDSSWQRYGVSGGQGDSQLLVSLTLNLGKR